MAYDDDNNSESSDDEDINDFWGEIPAELLAPGGGDGDDDDDNEEEAVDLRPPGAEHFLVLLDASPAMFVPAIRINNNNNNNKAKHSSNSQDSDDEDDDEDATPKWISPVDAALQALQDHLRQSVRHSVTTKSGKKNGFGLTLFGTRKRSRLDVQHELKKRSGGHKKNDDDDDDDMEVDEDAAHHHHHSDDDNDSDGDNIRNAKSDHSSMRTAIHHLIPLEPAGIDTIKTLRSCLPNVKGSGDRILDLEAEFGHSEKNKKKTGGDDQEATKDLSEALLTVLNSASQTFAEAKCVYNKPRKPDEKMGNDRKTLLIVSNQDDFCPGDDEEARNRREIIRNTINDLRDNGFEIIGWPLPNKNLKRSTVASSTESFFDQIATIPPELRRTLKHAMKRNNGEYDLEEIETVLAGSWKPVRAAFDVPLIFPDEVSSLIKESAKAKSQNGNGGGRTQTDGETQTSKVAATAQIVTSAIMLDFFSSVTLQSEPGKVKIQREMGAEEVPKEIEKITLMQTEATDLIAKFRSTANPAEKELEKNQAGLSRIRTFHKMKNGDLIPITDEEVAELKRRSNINSAFKSLTLLGFKKRDSVPFHFNLKSYFVYPNDKAIEGSVAAFAHLHRAMVKKNVIGIGELLTRKTATSHLVAIDAVEETFEADEDQEDDDSDVAKQQKYPPGWIVTLLPFENEIRSVPEDLSTEEGFQVPEEVLSATEGLIAAQRLQAFDLTDSGFKNPYLEKLWDYIESVALQEPMQLDKDYSILPVEDETLELLRGPVSALKLSLPEDEIPTRKRAAAKVAADDNTDWKAQLNNLSSYKVDDLKLACAKYGVKKSGNKKAIIDRLKEAIQAED